MTIEVPIAAYRILHFGGLFLLMMSLGAMCLGAMNSPLPPTLRKWLGMYHGIGSLLVAVAGFAMFAKLHLEWRGWIVGKAVIWLGLSMAPALIRRKLTWAKPLWLAIAASGFVAAWLAGTKPF